MVALVVSGGHTSLFQVDPGFRFWLMGRTLDDAAGEAFDKVAKMLGLGYPGGPAIERRAAASTGKAPRFPRAMLKEGSLDFSFSGLKTAVLNHLLSNGGDPALLGPGGVDNVCRGFQDAVVDVLLEKARMAVDQAGCRALAVAGGVTANGEIRRRFGEMAGREGIKLVVPDPVLCTDNAAMVAWNGWRLHAGGHKDPAGHSVRSRSQWPAFRRA
jgi:N6-L-threonylcarbamoyladenine synthase